MKVSKKRLIEIITEEISRVRKEGHRGMRAGTIGGGEHRKMDPHEPPTRRRSRRRKPVAPPEPSQPSPEERRALQLRHADADGYNDGFVYGHSKNRANYEHDPELVAVYNKRNELGLERHRAFHGAKNKKVSEGYGDYERGASDEGGYGGGDWSVRLDNARGDGVDDAKMEVNPWGGPHDEGILDNEEKYGPADNPSGRLGREYWESRRWARKELAAGRKVWEE